MRAVIIFLSLLSQSMAIKRRRAAPETPVDVGQILARGHRMSAPMASRPASDYVLSSHAARFNLTEENALLEGAPGQWPLWINESLIPNELPGDAGPQFLMVNDPHDWCASGDQAGYSVLNVSKPTIVPFLVPEDQENNKHAAVIVAPGGGNRFLSWTKEGTHAAKWLNSIGISAFVLKYRVPSNTFETQNKAWIDAQRAISTVKFLAPKLGLNASRIGFMGFSAGAFLTAKVATAPLRFYTANPQDPIDKMSYLPDFAMEIYGYGMPMLSSEHKAPPTFIAQAENDPCVPPAGALAYFGSIQKQAEGTDTLHELHLFSDGKHGFGDCSLYVAPDKWEPVCSWTLNSQLWLDRVFGIQKPMNYKPMLAENL